MEMINMSTIISEWYFSYASSKQVKESMIKSDIRAYNKYSQEHKNPCSITKLATTRR
jgi:hypothetical protein